MARDVYIRYVNARVDKQSIKRRYIMTTFQAIFTLPTSFPDENSSNFDEILTKF